MAFALSLRSWRLHEEQGERLEELAATVEVCGGGGRMLGARGITVRCVWLLYSD